jgi:N-acylneuraminate cytidylyltransferase/CMP-N,N'-diacetyllegionaminic acid synthase
MSIIGLIPARGGSKRIPMKNIQLLNGLPLINYTVMTAKKTPLLDRLICSTDDKIIADIAKQAGAEVPFLRPSEIAQDSTSDREVIIHLIKWLNESINDLIIVLLRPTTPFKNREIIEKSINLLIDNNKATAVRTVTEASGVYHPYWMYRKEENVLKPFINNIDITKYYQSQLLPKCYRLNGVVDVLRANIVINEQNIYGNNIFPNIIDPIYSIDIDDEIDFLYAEFIMKKFKRKISY